MQNLRDKLLKAGLVTEDQAKKATEPKPRPPRPERSEPRHQANGPLMTVRPQPLSSVPKLPPLPGSKAHQRLESRKQLETDKQLRELVHAHQVPVEPGETVFYFVTRKGKLRRLELSAAQAGRLEKGELAVVERPEPGQIEHSLVTAEGAQAAGALSPKAVRFFNRPGAPVGFLSDDDIKARQAAGESGDAGEPEAPEEDAQGTPDVQGGEPGPAA